MNRFLSPLFYIGILAAALTLSSCENPDQITEIPGEPQNAAQAVPEKSPETPPEAPAVSENDERVKALEEQVKKQEEQVKKLLDEREKERAKAAAPEMIELPQNEASVAAELEQIKASVDALRKLPADRSSASLLKYLSGPESLDYEQISYIQRLPNDERDALLEDIFAAQKEAVDILFADKTLTGEDLRKVTHLKARFTMQEGPDADLTPILETLEARGEKTLVWEVELMRLETTLQRMEESRVEPSEAQMDAMVDTTLALAKRADSVKGFTNQNIPFFFSVVLSLASEEKSAEAIQTLSEILKNAKPNENLSEETLKRALLYLEGQQVVQELFAAMDAQRALKSGENAEAETPDFTQKFDAVGDSLIALLKRTGEQKMFHPQQAREFLGLLTMLENTPISREKLTALAETLLGLVSESETADPETIQFFQGVVRRMGLIGKEMELVAEKPDGTSVLPQDFAGKTLLVTFRTTWSDPTLEETMNLRKAYAAYHESGFEILEILLDRTAEELKAADEKTREPWVQATLVPDGKGEENPILHYGMSGIGAFLIGADGKVIAVNVFGEKLFAELKKIFPDVVVPEDERPDFSELPEIDEETGEADGNIPVEPAVEEE